MLTFCSGSCCSSCQVKGFLQTILLGYDRVNPLRPALYNYVSTTVGLVCLPSNKELVTRRKHFAIFVLTGITLDGIQVYSTCADPAIRQSLADFMREKVLTILIKCLHYKFCSSGFGIQKTKKSVY